VSLNQNLGAFDRELRLYGDFDTNVVRVGHDSEGRARAVPCGPFHAVEVVARNLVSRRNALDRWNNQAILMVQHDGVTLARQYDHEIWLRRGDIYLMDTRAPLELTVPEASHATCIAIGRDDVAALGSRPQAVFGLKIGGDEGFARLTRYFLTGLLADRHFYDQAGAGTVAQALQSLLAQALQSRPYMPAALDQLDPLEKVKTWILRNLDDPTLNVSRISRHFGLSRSALYRLFATDGDSPQAWLTAQRLGRAHELLSEPSARGKSVSTICYALGFNDPSHFSRLFRQRFGCAPSDIRRIASRNDAYAAVASDSPLGNAAPAA
jgi:AraC-like DNA-binding protein